MEGDRKGATSVAPFLSLNAESQAATVVRSAVIFVPLISLWTSVAVVHDPVATFTVVVDIVLACHFFVFGLAVWLNVIFTPIVIVHPLSPGAVVDFISILASFLIVILVTFPLVITINIFLAVNNPFPTWLDPRKIVNCIVCAGHWNVPVPVHKIVFGLSVPSDDPSLALIVTCTFVTAPDVPMPTIASPPAGTSSAAPTHMARINNRASMGFPFVVPGRVCRSS